MTDLAFLQHDDTLAASEVDPPAPAAEPAPDVQPQPAPEPAPEPEPQPQPQSQNPPPGFVPVSALQALREELRVARNGQHREPAEQAAPGIPDRYEDPEGYEAFRQAQIDERLQMQTFGFSRQMAEMRHGAEVTNQVQAWAAAKCDQDPYFNAQMLQSQDPFGAAVQAWKQEQALTQLGGPGDIDAFLQWKATQTGQSANPAAAPAAPRPSAPSAPPRSLAGAPSAGSIATQVAGPEPFDAAFPIRKQPNG